PMTGLGKKGLGSNPTAAKLVLNTRDWETEPVICGNKKAAARIARPRASWLVAWLNWVVRFVWMALLIALSMDTGVASACATITYAAPKITKSKNRTR